MYSDMRLLDIVDVGILQEIQDRFSEATGLGAIIVDLKGDPITKYSMFSPYCKMIRNHPGGAALCRRSDATLGHQASTTRKTEVHFCHAGLIDIAAPIIVNGVHIASVLCGQVLPEDDSSEEGDALFHKCAADLDIDKGALQGLRNNIGRIPKKQIRAAADLLQIISNYIVGMSLSYMNEVLINDINLKMVEEQRARIDLEKSLKDSELKALQSQVNPHFLFNALNTIARLAMLENAPKTEEVAFYLADLLRHSLQKNGKLVSIGSEAEHIKKYLQIQKIRFSDRLKYILTISERIIDFHVPVMTLQPLVENAIVHGLDQKMEDGTIQVSGYMKQGKIILEVSDNGMGMEKKTVAMLQKIMKDETKNDQETRNFSGLGIINVYRQLRYFYDDQIQLNIKSTPGEGTMIQIEISCSTV